MDDSSNSDQNEELSPMLAPKNPRTTLSRNVYSRSQIMSHAVPRGVLAVIEVLFKMKNFVSYYAECITHFISCVNRWVRTHKKETAITLFGIIIFALSCAMPATLGALGFGASGPVLGSIAAGWQASMGTVAAGSLFAFLQSAAMGGAAMGLFTGIGALGAVMAMGGGLATINVVKEKCGEVVRGAAATIQSGYQTVVAKSGKLWRKLWGL